MLTLSGLAIPICGRRPTCYFALAADDFSFFDNAMARHLPEQKGDWTFRQTPGGYLPEEYSLQDPNVLRWHREYLQKKTPMRNAHDTRTFFRHSLLQHFMDSYTFIPLNNRPSQWLAQSGLTYVLPDAFVSSSREWAALRSASDSIISELTERVNLDGMGWSVNWAAYHANYLTWLFFPVHLAAKIGQSISNEGGELVCALNCGEAYTTHLIRFPDKNCVLQFLSVGYGGNAAPPCLSKCSAFQRDILSRIPIQN
jgi:hypothetical protein